MCVNNRHRHCFKRKHRISGLVVEYIVAIDVTRVRFPADACMQTLRFSVVRVVANVATL